MKSDWKPIETVPKEPLGDWGNAPRVVFASKNLFLGVGYWSDMRKAYWLDGSGWISEKVSKTFDNTDYLPTHWDYLPNLPTS